MQIDWWTFALQTVNFLVLVWLLWRFLYKPVGEVIDRRKALAERAFSDARKKAEEAEAAKLRFEDGQAQLSQERQDMLRKVHQELEDERSKLLEKARREAEQLIETAHGAIAEEREAALGEIREQAAGLAVELASNFLRQAGSDLSTDVFLEQLEKQLTDLSEVERDRLQKDLAADDACLTIVTAYPLALEEEDRWTSRLGVSLGQMMQTGFVTDAGIVGGAELQFPHTVLKITWADQLEKAKELLGQDEPAS